VLAPDESSPSLDSLVEEESSPELDCKLTKLEKEGLEGGPEEVSGSPGSREGPGTVPPSYGPSERTGAGQGREKMTKAGGGAGTSAGNAISIEPAAMGANTLRYYYFLAFYVIFLSLNSVSTA